jgi:hypothetical protein
MAVSNLFASKSVPEHFVRGTFGIAAYYGAGMLLALPSLTALGAAVVLGVVSLVVMRGCPVCWTIGLMNTTRNQMCPIPIKSKK